MRIPQPDTALHQCSTHRARFDTEFGADLGQRLPSFVQSYASSICSPVMRLPTDRYASITKHLDDTVLIETVEGADG